ncbi:MAG: PD-(D/E)XK nuclease family protein [Actinomycetaceae bacterium]|nr:PD-(D/E)XK nuclease family protein [Actinomycetaceae bacterium]
MTKTEALAPAQAMSAAQILDLVQTGGHVTVAGLPRSGKSALVLEAAARLAQGMRGGVHIWAPTRIRVDALRRAMRLGDAAARFDQVKVETPIAWAYRVVNDARGKKHIPPVRLATGADVDGQLSEILDGIENWPADLPHELRAMPAFVLEVRDFVTRIRDWGITSEELRGLAQAQGPDYWQMLAQVMDEQDRTLSLKVADSRKAALPVDIMRLMALSIDVIAGLGEAQGSSGQVDIPRVLIVDDMTDCTLIHARVMKHLAQCGTQIIAVGNPDAVVEGFRGATPGILSRLANDLFALGGRDVAQVALQGMQGIDPQIEEFLYSAVASLPLHGFIERRKPKTISEGEVLGDVAQGWDGLHGVSLCVGTDESQQIRLAARMLREHHLHDGVAWEDMALIVRSTGLIDALTIELQGASVPVRAMNRPILLAQHTATRPLLLCLELVTSAAPVLEFDLARYLLTSVLMGRDALYMRLHAAQIHEDIQRLQGNDFDACGDVQDPHLKKLCGLLGAARAVIAKDPGNVLGALWKLWEGFDVAKDWQNTCLDASNLPSVVEIHHQNLDMVMALFKAGEWWVERNPGRHAKHFADEYLSQRVPSDTVAPSGIRAPAVSVLTPAQAAGQNFSVVAVLGLIDGAWPNLKRRDGILKVNDVLAKLGDAGVLTDRQGILDDELRLFVAACSRANRYLIIASVNGSEDTPSAFAGLAARLLAAGDRELYQDLLLGQVAGPALDERGIVAYARNGLLEPELDTGKRDFLAEVLATLAHIGVDEAQPENWWGALSPSTTGAPYDGDVTLSPSKLEKLITCPLNALLESAGGREEGEVDAASIGTLIHELAEEAQRHFWDEGRFAQAKGEDVYAWMCEALDERFAELEVPPGWLEDVTRSQIQGSIKMLAFYMAKHPRFTETECQIEYRHAVKLPSADEEREGQAHEVVIRGRVDRLEYLGTEESEKRQVEVADIKTGAVTKNAVPANLQLGSYQLALEQEGLECMGAKILSVKTEVQDVDKIVAPQGHLDDVLDDVASKKARVNTQLLAALGVEDTEDTTIRDSVLKRINLAGAVACSQQVYAVVGDSCSYCRVKDCCPLVAQGKVSDNAY